MEKLEKPDSVSGSELDEAGRGGESPAARDFVTESAKALAGTIQVRRYCNSRFRILAGHICLGIFGWANVFKNVLRTYG